MVGPIKLPDSYPGTYLFTKELLSSLKMILKGENNPLTIWKKKGLCKD